VANLVYCTYTLRGLCGLHNIQPWCNQAVGCGDVQVFKSLCIDAIVTKGVSGLKSLHLSGGFDKYGLTFRQHLHRWQAISPIAIGFTVPWSVCLSHSNGRIEDISKRFLLHTTASCLSQTRVKIWSTPSNPNFALKSTKATLLIWALGEFNGKLRPNG